MKFKAYWWTYNVKPPFLTFEGNIYPFAKTSDTGKTSVGRHCSWHAVIGISEPELHESVLTGWKCTFSRSGYLGRIDVSGMLLLEFNAGIEMSQKLYKISSQRKKKWAIWMNGSIIVKQNVRIPIFLLDTLFLNGVVYLKLVYFQVSFDNGHASCLHR